MRALHARKCRIIAGFAAHRREMLMTGKFDLIRRNGRFLDPHTVELSDGRRVPGRFFLIATGSKLARPPVPGLGAIESWTSDDVLQLDFVPSSVLVLGGGSSPANWPSFSTASVHGWSSCSAAPASCATIPPPPRR